jgi:hypothetical protein
MKDPDTSPKCTEVVKRGRRRNKNKNNSDHDRCILEH